MNSQLLEINDKIVKILATQTDKIDEKHDAYVHYEKKYEEKFNQAYQELQNGQKKICWMWYIFPIQKWTKKTVGSTSPRNWDRHF